MTIPWWRYNQDYNRFELAYIPDITTNEVELLGWVTLEALYMTEDEIRQLLKNSYPDWPDLPETETLKKMVQEVRKR